MSAKNFTISKLVSLKRESKYLLVLAGFIILFVVVQVFSPKPVDWTPTYLSTDKNPFGAYITNSLLKSFFDGDDVKNTNLTLYELSDSVYYGENIMSISNSFDADGPSTNVLLTHVFEGSHAFISANSFSGKFRDTLHLFTGDVFYDLLHKPGGTENDTSDLKLVLPDIEKKGYYFRLENIPGFFSSLDSLRTDAFVIATNAWGKPVTLRIPWGKGYFILNATPLAFTNNYLLYEDNSDFASKTFSFLPITKTWWTSYYQMGRQEAQSPLRFILSHEALKWAYYIGLFSLFLFILIEARRKQRIIPVIKPLTNTTLKFVKTIGDMYLHAQDHKSVAEKMIAFFLDNVRSAYFLTPEINDEWIVALARKSGNDPDQTKKLFILIRLIQNSTAIAQSTLVELNDRLEDFTKSKTPSYGRIIQKPH
jgi:hypothetical protein